MSVSYVAMRTRLGCREAPVSSSSALRLRTELPDHLFDSGLEGLCRECAGRRGGQAGHECGSFRREGLLGDLFVCLYTLVHSHAQPPQHNRDDSIQSISGKPRQGCLAVRPTLQCSCPQLGRRSRRVAGCCRGSGRRRASP